MRRVVSVCLALSFCIAGPAAAQDGETSPGHLFDVAIDGRDVEAVKELLAAGHSPNAPIVHDTVTSTPLVKACRRRSMEIVRLLVEAGADVNGLERDRRVNDLGEVHWFIQSPLEKVVGEDLEIVRYLIGKGAKVNERLTSGVTVLNLPAYDGDLETLEVLLAAGGDVNAVDDIGYTPLKHAVMGRKPEAIRLLVAKGAKVNQAPTKLNAGETALHVAIGRGFPDIVQLLLELKANPDAKAKHSGTPLDLARKGDQDDVVAMLKAAGAASTSSASGAEAKTPPVAEPATWTGTASGAMTAQGTKTPLRHAYAVVVRPRNAAADETRLVLSEEPVPLEILEELLRRLPSFGFRGVEVVLDAGGDVSAVFFHHDELPAGLEVREVAKLAPAAAEAGRLAGRVVFDDPGFSFGFDATFDAPLFRPATKPSRAADPGLPSEEQGKVALEVQVLALTPGDFDRVVGEGDVEAVKLFLAAGRRATTGEPGGSVLESAVEGGHAEVVRVLLAAGADPNGVGYAGRPLLAAAAERQGTDVVRALVAGGADVTRKGAGNATALLAAAAGDRLDNVEVLLASGAKVTARTSSGWTPLHWAVQRGDLPMVKRLIAAGADVPRDRKELLEFARSAKSPEVEKAIRDAPATPKE